MIYLLLLFMTSLSYTSEPQKTQSYLQQIAHNSSLPTQKYPSQHTINYKLKKKPYTFEEKMHHQKYESLVTQQEEKIQTFGSLLQQRDQILYPAIFINKASINIQDHLKTLGIDEEEYQKSSSKQYLISNRFRTLSLRYHPDKNKTEKVNEQWHKIQNAKENLTNLHSIDVDDSYDKKILEDINKNLKRIKDEIKLSTKEIDKSYETIYAIERKRCSIQVQVQPKSQLPYQGKKNNSSLIYKLIAWSEQEKLKKEHALQKSALQKHINLVLYIPTLKEYQEYLDGENLSLLEKSFKKNEFIFNQNILHTAKNIVLENPEIIFESPHESIEDKIQHVFSLIVKEIQRQP